MIISIDTEVINAMAALARQANDKLDACVDALAPVVEHNDWNCKERDGINENIAKVKNGNKRVKETVESFAAAMVRVADQFNAVEAAIPNKYQFIDTLVGSAISAYAGAGTSVTSNVGGATGEVIGNISQSVHISGGLENYALGNLDEPIRMCNFADMDLSNLT